MAKERQSQGSGWKQSQWSDVRDTRPDPNAWECCGKTRPGNQARCQVCGAHWRDAKRREEERKAELPRSIPAPQRTETPEEEKAWRKAELPRSLSPSLASETSGMHSSAWEEPAAYEGCDYSATQSDAEARRSHKKRNKRGGIGAADEGEQKLKKNVHDDADAAAGKDKKAKDGKSTKADKTDKDDDKDGKSAKADKTDKDDDKNGKSAKADRTYKDDDNDRKSAKADKKDHDDDKAERLAREQQAQLELSEHKALLVKCGIDDTQYSALLAKAGKQFEWNQRQFDHALAFGDESTNAKITKIFKEYNEECKQAKRQLAAKADKTNHDDDNAKQKAADTKKKKDAARIEDGSRNECDDDGEEKEALTVSPPFSLQWPPHSLRASSQEGWSRRGPRQRGKRA